MPEPIPQTLTHDSPECEASTELHDYTACSCICHERLTSFQIAAYTLFRGLAVDSWTDSRQQALDTTGRQATEQETAAGIYLTALGTGLRIGQTHPHLVDQLVDILAATSAHPDHRAAWRDMFDAWWNKALAELEAIDKELSNA